MIPRRDGWRFLLKDLSGSILWISHFSRGGFYGFLKIGNPQNRWFIPQKMTIILDDLVSSFQLRAPRCSLDFGVVWIKPNCLGQATDQPRSSRPAWWLMLQKPKNYGAAPVGWHRWSMLIAFVVRWPKPCRTTSVSSHRVIIVTGTVEISVWLTKAYDLTNSEWEALHLVGHRLPKRIQKKHVGLPSPYPLSTNGHSILLTSDDGNTMIDYLKMVMLCHVILFPSNKLL